MKTMRVLRDGWEIERIVERVEVKEETLYGGCPERVDSRNPPIGTVRINVLSRKYMAVIRSRAVPG